MAKPYSNDFRQKVPEEIELNGLKKTEASQLFHISRKTINLWCRRKAQTGDVQPQPKPTSSPKQKIKGGEKFPAFVKAHGEKTQSQMAQLWEGQISQPTISRALKKLEYTRKKKLTGISNATPAKRGALDAELPQASHLVIVDESAMDERDNYGYGYAPAGERLTSNLVVVRDASRRSPATVMVN
ncbi:MAG: hypothetical protein F6K10_00220 [Moorea sp. SIO2B7]|nr:hypothetical protein [Moorena sp. SIO2B7]